MRRPCKYAGFQDLICVNSNRVKTLEQSGILETLLRRPDLTSTRALTEDEIREATATLKASTATCAKQVATLKSQLELIERLQTDSRAADRNQERYITGTNRQHLLEKQRIKAMVQLDILLRHIQIDGVELTH